MKCLIIVCEYLCVCVCVFVYAQRMNHCNCNCNAVKSPAIIVPWSKRKRDFNRLRMIYGIKIEVSSWHDMSISPRGIPQINGKKIIIKTKRRKSVFPPCSINLCSICPNSHDFHTVEKLSIIKCLPVHLLSSHMHLNTFFCIQAEISLIICAYFTSVCGCACTPN